MAVVVTVNPIPTTVKIPVSFEAAGPFCFSFSQPLIIALDEWFVRLVSGLGYHPGGGGGGCSSTPSKHAPSDDPYRTQNFGTGRLGVLAF